MIGYLKPHLKNLPPKLKKEYRAVYCGLCHALKTKHGIVGMMCLNYELTLLLILNMGIHEEEQKIFYGACSASPAILVPYIDYYAESVMAAADISLIVASTEAEDNLADDKAFKWKIASKILSRASQKISLDSASEIKAAIENYYNSEKDSEIDYASIIQYCGDLVEVLALPLVGNLPDESKECFLLIANNIGKWVYLVDACDDWANDRKNATFNPINLFPEDLEPQQLIHLIETLIADDLQSLRVNHYQELINYLLTDNLKNISQKIIQKYERERQNNVH